MPRGRRKTHKRKLSKGALKSILSIFLVVTGLLSLVSVFSSSGTLLSVVNEAQNLVFGYAAILFAFTTFFVALLLFRESLEIPFINIRSFFGLLVFDSCSFGLLSALEKVLKRGELPNGFENGYGGFIGLSLFSLLTRALTSMGALIVLLAGVAIAFILIFDVSIDQILKLLLLILEKVKALRPTVSLPKMDFSSTGGSSYSAPYTEDEEEHSQTTETASKKKDSKKEAVFEVIQPALEPVDTKATAGKVLHSGISTKGVIQSGLPYTDRVWEYPPIDLLSDYSSQADRGDVTFRKQLIEKTLSRFGINAKVLETNFGPAVTQYALEINSVTKIAKVTNLQNDLALALASPTGSVRIEAPIPGKSLIGIEVPNIATGIVSFKSVITSDSMKGSKSKLSIALGHDVSGMPRVADISKMPHLLIAGSTGSGKSVFLHSILFSILYRCSPAECKIIMVDPKRVELVNYNDIPHLLIPPITDAEKAPNAFKWAVAEMERRYKLFENAKVRNITAYNELSGFQALSYIVILVDELAELMALQPGEMEKSICRLAQLSRATGIHLVLATQSPRVDVITGLIKANIPTRVAFSVSSQVESRIIMDTVGAEKLLGKGDMLYIPPETSKPTRIQGVFVSDKEIANLVGFLKNSGVKPDYKDDVMKPQIVQRGEFANSTDELFEEAVKIITTSDKASASLLQRKLSIGYARAARLLDELEAKGIVGASDGSKPRDVLIRNPDIILSQEDSAPESL
ncbi:MAG: DNA translocase FtsK 4TM domain-containing protein [Patescibacteria group bacterium]